MIYAHFEADDSYCCSNNPVQLWWVNGRTVGPNESVDAILDRIEPLLRDGDRYWNDFMIDDRLGQIEALLERAQQGKLQPISEIKPVHRSSPRRLFEIRQEIDVEYRTIVGAVVADRQYDIELLRIYHGETRDLPAHALHLHLHFKDTDKDAKVLQNDEIDYAATIYDNGEPDSWGIPR